jgi:hypothetical protein
MSFVKFLQGIGDRLGLLETIAATGAPPTVSIQTRMVSLQELASEINSGEIRALADSPAELSVSFDVIYKTAGIPSNPQDWTIERLKQFVSSDSLKGKSREEMQQSILAMLNSEGVPVEKIVKDAMARDRAIDSYEAFVRDKMQVRMKTCKNRLMELKSRIRDLQEESKALETTMNADEEKWREWRKHKRAREKELALLVGYIVDHSVITLDNEDGD